MCMHLIHIFFRKGKENLEYDRISIIFIKVRNEAKIRKQYNHVPHLTEDTTWKSDINTIEHHERQSKGQPKPNW